MNVSGNGRVREGNVGSLAYLGTGRRKASIARVRLIPGNGGFTLVTSGKRPRTAEEYFGGNQRFLITIKSPLEMLNLLGDYDVWARVDGGGLSGQASAICLGISRALCELSPDNRAPLKASGFLTRDPRVKERKKYGLHKARKAPQFSKR